MSQSNSNITREILKLKKKRDNILEEMGRYRDATRGTITSIYKMCSNKECECHSTNRKKHGLAYYISSSHQGRTKMLYIPSSMLEEAQKRTEGYKKLRGLIVELSNINRERFKLEKELKKGD